MSIWFRNWGNNLKKGTCDFLLFHPLCASISPPFFCQFIIAEVLSPQTYLVQISHFDYIHSPLPSWLNTYHFPLYICILMIMTEAWRYFIVPDVIKTWRFKSSGMWHCVVGWVWSQKTWFFSSFTVRIPSLASLTPYTVHSVDTREASNWHNFSVLNTYWSLSLAEV
jgi:hypothetical protein